MSYEIAVPLTPDQRAELEAKAQAQMRSVSSYVALVIAENLRGPWRTGRCSAAHAERAAGAVVYTFELGGLQAGTARAVGGLGCVFHLPSLRHEIGDPVRGLGAIRVTRSRCRRRKLSERSGLPRRAVCLVVSGS